MSLTASEYRRRRQGQSAFYYKLANVRPLSKEALTWMRDHGKEYRPEIIDKFQIREAVLQCFDQRAPTESRGFVSADPVITFPAGNIQRAYRYRQPDKNMRWRCVPTGEDARWVALPSFDEVIITEGEWDMFRLHDLGCDSAIAHSAGAGTWLSKWTPLFAGKKVWICFDRDRIGQQGAAKVAQNLFPVAKDVRLVDLPLPGTPESNDISDFFRVGGTADGFRELLRKARAFIPTNRLSGRRGGLHGRRVYAYGTQLASKY
jgi:hypothetical protein